MGWAQRAAAIARALSRALGAVLKRAGRRLYQMYLKPVEMFEEIKVAPDASGAALLLAVAFAIQTAAAAAAVAGITISSPQGSTNLLESFTATLAAYVAIRGASLFVFWFILFIIFWFIMYALGSRIEGFTVFSATGYMLSSQLVTFLVTLLTYVAAASGCPSVVVATGRGVYPQYAMLATLLYRLSMLPFAAPAQLLFEAVRYFGTIWNAVLVALMFKVLGDLNWKRAGLGAAAAIAVSWLLASLFRAAGML